MATFKNLISTTADSISSGGSISGDLTIEGDLTVDGGGGFAYSEVLTGDMSINGPEGTGAASAGVLVLSTAEETVRVGTVDQLGRIDFQAPSETGGSDAILVGASIHAVAAEDFAADNNSTALVFSTGTTTAPVERLRIDQDGNTIFAGDINLSTSDKNISWGGDTHNKIFGSSAGDYLKFYANNQLKLTLNSTGAIFENGNVGIGVSALEAWHADYTSLQLGGNASIIAKTTDQVSNPLNILQNVYFDDNWKKIIGDESSRYSQQDGQHIFMVNSATGSPDDTVTWTTAMTIDSAGYVNVGHATNLALGPAAASYLQIATTNPQVAMLRSVDSEAPPHLNLTKSRGAAPGTIAIVEDDDRLGQISFNGDDGVDYQSMGAYIQAKVDGTPGSNDMPGRLIFGTTADGASSPTDRLTIDSSGNVGIGTAAPAALLELYEPNADPASAGVLADSAINLWNSTIVDEYSQITFGYSNSRTNAAAYFGYLNKNGIGFGAGDLVFGTRSVTTDTQPTERMRIDSSGNVGIGTDDPSALLDLAGQFSDSVNTNLSIEMGNRWGFRVATSSNNEDLHLDGNLSGTPFTCMTWDKINGNVGIGVSPEAWDSTFTTLRIGALGSLSQEAGADDKLYLGNNAYYDDTDDRWEFIEHRETSLYEQDTGTHQFHVSAGAAADSAITWTTPMSIANSGDVTFTGDLIMADGKGIDFSADASPAAGMTAEILDDYEEGTGTPTVALSTSGTVTLQGGETYYYIKVGNIVHYQFEFQTTAISSPVGTLTVSLPFAQLSGRYAAGSLRVYSETFDGSPFVGIETGTSVALLLCSKSGTGNQDITPTAGTRYYYGSVTYRVN